jgi:adenylate cyclase
LVSDICELRLKDGVTPERLMRDLNTFFGLQVPIIDKHSGMVIRSVGDALQAVWFEQRNGMEHAQRAFDAACEMLREFERRNSATDFGWSIRIGLGTGDMVGDFFRPIDQFQVLGRAPNIADELFATRYTTGSAVLLTPETSCLLKLTRPLRSVGSLRRETGEEIEVLAWQMEA